MADATFPRKPDHPIDDLFLTRWSPRAFTGEQIPVETLMSLFEAARWSPSSYNSQPWRFVWARRGTPIFETFLGLLTGSNPEWCRDAAALVLVASSKTMSVPGKDEPVPSRTHSYDTGAAWMAIALQAHLLGWATHGMIGFDYDRAAAVIGLPAGFHLDAALAIGKQGDPAKLSDGLRSRESPNARKPMAESVFEGRFPG
ncbi:MAG: nitroreductase family protein [Methylobacteriaceae bacterium]|nr:nitroreductase family protein [Methylobacteriaceae bacterium]